ncbi:MAG: alpha/beta hydrolase [Pseudomonadota bacterium]
MDVAVSKSDSGPADQDSLLDSGFTAHFFEMAGNRSPAGGRVGVVETPDGFRLRHARWAADTKRTRGTVLLLHGRTEFIEKYFETVQDLRARGYAVLTFDWRGQGASTRHTTNRRKGYVESYDEYGIDLATIVSEVLLPDCRPPFSVIAHSMGGLAALYNADVLSRQVARMVLLAPFTGFFDLPAPRPVVHFAMALLMALGLGEVYTGGGDRPEERRPFANNLLTSDAGRFERNRKLMTTSGDLALGGPTAAWTRATIKAQKRVMDPAFSSTIRIPSLMVAAGNDKVTANRDVERLVGQMRSASFLMLKGARHEILHEQDLIRDQLFAAVDAFFPGEPPSAG